MIPLTRCARVLFTYVGSKNKTPGLFWNSSTYISALRSILVIDASDILKVMDKAKSVNIYEIPLDSKQYMWSDWVVYTTKDKQPMNEIGKSTIYNDQRGQGLGSLRIHLAATCVGLCR